MENTTNTQDDFYKQLLLNSAYLIEEAVNVFNDPAVEQYYYKKFKNFPYALKEFAFKDAMYAILVNYENEDIFIHRYNNRQNINYVPYYLSMHKQEETENSQLENNSPIRDYTVECHFENSPMQVLQILNNDNKENLFNNIYTKPGLTFDYKLADTDYQLPMISDYHFDDKYVPAHTDTMIVDSIDPTAFGDLTI